MSSISYVKDRIVIMDELFSFRINIPVRSFGRMFAELDAGNQARFLCAAAAEMASWGSYRMETQINQITDQELSSDARYMLLLLVRKLYPDLDLGLDNT